MNKSIDGILQVVRSAPLPSAKRRMRLLRGRYTVPLAILHTTQNTYDSDIADAYLAGTRVADKPPVVLVFEGVVYLENDHHRAVSAHRQGRSILDDCRVYVDADPRSRAIASNLQTPTTAPSATRSRQIR